MVWGQTAGDGAKKSDGIESVPTPRKSLMGTRWGPSGLQPSMSDLVDWPMDWMELLKSLHSSLIQMAQPGEDVARKFVYKWEVKMIFPAPNVKLLLLNGFKDKDICSKRWG